MPQTASAPVAPVQPFSQQGEGNVLFVQNVWHELLGVGFLSTVLKRAGFTPWVEVFGNTRRLAALIEETNPLFVGVPVISGSHGWAEHVARTVKNTHPHLPVIMGGPHPTFYPDAIRDSAFDALVRGEAEESVLDMAVALMGQRSVDAIRDIPNVVTRHEDGSPRVNPLRHLSANLDDIGPSDREIYQRLPYFRQETLFPVLTTRGCPYSCSYCFNHHYREMYRGNGKPIRLRDMDSVLAECRELKERHGATCLNFVDDIFGLKQDWALAFLDRYATEVAVPFLCNTKSDLFNEDMARALKKAGCHALQFGLESAGEDVRKTLRRTDKDHHYDALSGLGRKYDLPLRAYYMIGVPGQGVQGSLDTITLARRMGVKYAFVSIFQPYPGTTLGDMLRAQGVVEDSPDDLHQSALRASVVKDTERRTIENLQKLSFLMLYFPALTPPLLRLCHLPPNRVFDLVYLLSFWITQASLTRRGLWRTLTYGVKNIRFFYDKENKAGLPAGP